MQQVASLLLRRKPDNTIAEYFHDAHLEITVPASVPLQLDGSVVKPKDYVGKAEYAKLQQAGDMEQSMVTYNFDALPRALEVAIPQTYNYELLEPPMSMRMCSRRIASASRSMSRLMSAAIVIMVGKSLRRSQQEHTVAVESRPEHEQNGQSNDDVKKELPELVDKLLANGRKVTIVGKAPLAGKKATYIIAGGISKALTGETQPVAVVVNEKTAVYNHQGDKLSSQAVEDLPEGGVIVVEGDKSKRGVIGATRLIV